MKNVTFNKLNDSHLTLIDAVANAIADRLELKRKNKN